MRQNGVTKFSYTPFLVYSRKSVFYFFSGKAYFALILLPTGRVKQELAQQCSLECKSVFLGFALEGLVVPIIYSFILSTRCASLLAFFLTLSKPCQPFVNRAGKFFLLFQFIKELEFELGFTIN